MIMADTGDDDLDQDETPRWLVVAYVTLGTIMLTLLIGHVLWPKHFKVDTPTLGLLVLLILLPLVDRIEVLKGGGVEARLRARTRRRVREVRARTEAVLPQPPREPVDEVRGEEELVRQVGDAAKLLAVDRLELERSLLALAERRQIPIDDRSNIRRLANQLVGQGLLTPIDMSLINDVVPLLNQAVHGRSVDWDNALVIHEVVERLRSRLDSL
jgi:hypothetical protein